MNAIVNAAPQSMGAVASVFAGQKSEGELSGGITGGYGLMKYKGKVWTASYHGVESQLMRDDGDGPRNSIEVVILKAHNKLSKIWYEAGYTEGSNAAPDCASADGIAPDNGVPKKQSNFCATCPKNAWGSAANGGKGKACGDSRRLAIVPLPDIDNEALGGPMLLRCPAASLQDLAQFDAKYSALGYPYYSMGIKIAFDTNESYPKFIFSAVRPLTEEEGRKVVALRAGDAVARVIAENVAPLTQQVTHQPEPAQPLFEQSDAGARAPVQEQAPVQQQVAQQPVQQPVVQQQAPVQQPVQQAAPQAAPAAAGGFGAAQPVAQAQQPVQQPVQAVQQAAVQQPVVQQQAPVEQPVVQQQAPVTQQQAPQRAMTGFGAAQTVAADPAPATQQSFAGAHDGTGAAAPARPVSPPVVNDEFDAGLDAKLAALIGE